MSNLGTLSAGNVVLTNTNGSINFLTALATTPKMEVLNNVFDASFANNNQVESFDTYALGTATVTRGTKKNYISLFAPNTGDISILQSKLYQSTSSSASRIIIFSVNLDPLNAINTINSTYLTRAGAFDDATQKLDSAVGDGFFYQLDKTGFSVCARSSTDGSTGTDVLVAQVDWNIDKCDGTGLSQFTMQSSVINQFIIVYENSSAKLGICANGSVIFCHKFNDFTRTQTLPVRVELKKLAASAATAEVRVYKASISTSGKAVKGIKRSIGMKAAARDLSVDQPSLPVLSIRLAQPYARATALLAAINISSTVNLYYEIVLNGTLTNAVYGSAGANSICQLDKNATSIANGTIVQSGYISAKIPLSIEMKELLPLASGITGISDMYTINVTALMASGLVWASCSVEEIL